MAQIQLNGSEALRALEERSGTDLKHARQLVEDAAAADIASYFKGAGLGELAPNLCSTLVAAALAGGQWGFNNLITRLSASKVDESDQEIVANEILEIVAPLAKILNYARFRAGSIQSYVAQCDIPSLKLQTMLLSKSDFEQYGKIVAELKKFGIKDQSTMWDWIDKVDELCEFLSNSQMENNERNEKLASKSKKGTVSTKSISSYSKHWKSYASEVLSQILGLNWTGDVKETIGGRVGSLEEYRTRTWAEIQKELSESISTRRAFTSTKRKNIGKATGSRLITEETNLSGRLLTLTFNSSGLDGDLIQPALNSIKGQLLRSNKKDKISVSMKTDSTSLSIEIEKPSKDDLKTIEILLNSHR